MIARDGKKIGQPAQFGTIAERREGCVRLIDEIRIGDKGGTVSRGAVRRALLADLNACHGSKPGILLMGSGFDFSSVPPSFLRGEGSR